jgi:hypothetical protein
LKRGARGEQKPMTQSAPIQVVDDELAQVCSSCPADSALPYFIPKSTNGSVPQLVSDEEPDDSNPLAWEQSYDRSWDTLYVPFAALHRASAYHAPRALVSAAGKRTKMAIFGCATRPSPCLGSCKQLPPLPPLPSSSIASYQLASSVKDRPDSAARAARNNPLRCCGTRAFKLVRLRASAIARTSVERCRRCEGNGLQVAQRQHSRCGRRCWT